MKYTIRDIMQIIRLRRVSTLKAELETRTRTMKLACSHHALHANDESARLLALVMRRADRTHRRLTRAMCRAGVVRE